MCGPACIPGLFPFVAGAAGGLFTASKTMNSQNISRKGFEYKGEKSHNKDGKTSKLKVHIELVRGKDAGTTKKSKGKKSKGKGKTKKANSEKWILKKNNVVKGSFSNMKKGVMAYKKLIKMCESKGYDKC